MQILIPQLQGEARVSAFLTSFHLVLMLVSTYTLSCKKLKNPKRMDSHNAHGLAHNTPRRKGSHFSNPISLLLMPSESIQYFQTSEALRAGERDHLGVKVTALGNTYHSQCVLYSLYVRAR